MNIYNCRQKHLYVYLLGSFSALIRFNQLSDIWLFNCFEGCQHVLANKKIKIAQIKRIIIPCYSVTSLNGLLGLLSTVSLNTASYKIDIYGPRSLCKYIFWGRKYSKTNFRHKLYFYDISDGIMVRQINAHIGAFIYRYKPIYADYNLLNSEEAGPFNSENAKKYNIPAGPLYHYFKIGQNFILPDGSIVYGQKFVRGYYLGGQIALVDCFSKKLELVMISSNVCIIRY